MVVLRHRQAPQVADDEQRVRVHGVGVEQVVLHAADDAAERRNVAAEHAVQVHAPQLVRDAGRRAQDLEEQPVIARMLAELFVDQPQVARQLTDRRCAHAADRRVLLDDHEQLEQRRRVAVEHVVVGDLDVVVADLEARIHRHRRGVRPGEDRFAEQLQQHFVQQAHVHRRAVVALHELLDRERVGRVLVAEHLREPDLVIEQQPVFAAVRQHVQREADLPQERLRRFQLAQLALRQEAVLDQLFERVAAEVALRDPADRLDVAQPARARLHVRLEVVSGVVIAVMARGLLGDLGLEEIARRPDALGRERAPHRLEQRLRARPAGALRSSWSRR